MKARSTQFPPSACRRTGFALGSMLIVSLLLFSSRGFSQGNPQSPNQTGKANFYEIQKQFNDYWKGRTVTKGSGYKVFRRWEWYWEQRVGKSGVFPPNDVVQKGWEKYVADNGTDNVNDTAGNWTPMGPLTPPTKGYVGLGRINCIAFHPTDKNIFWIGSPSGGIWKTTDFGQSWTCLNGQQPVLGVSDIAVDPNDPQTIYIATGDGDDGSFSNVNGSGSGDTKSLGVWKTTDGGSTWNPTALVWKADSSYLIRRLIMSPLNSGTLYAATTAGIYMLTNGGSSVEKQANGCFKDIMFKPGEPATMYAATQGDGDKTNGQIFRTIDGGLQWIQKTNFSGVARIKLAVSPLSPTLVEALCSGKSRGLYGIYRSTNSGDGFALYLSVAQDCSNNYLHSSRQPVKDTVNPCGGQGEYDLCYLINPADVNERWIGGVNTWRSTDGGANWTMRNYWCNEEPGYAEVHADKHWFTYHPLQPGTFFEGNDGGISYTTDGGSVWKDISAGLQIGQIYKIANSYTNPKIVSAGFQDNGSQIYNDGTWLAPTVIGGDGMGCQIDNFDANIKYASYCDGVIYRTKSADWIPTITISKLIPGGQPEGAWVTPFILDPKDTAVLYAGFKMHIYKATKRGESWTRVFTQPAPVAKWDLLFRVLAISESDPKVMYASTGYRMFKTSNGWTSYDTIALPISLNMLTGIAVHSKNPNTLYISFSGYTNGKKVFKSVDGGATWDTISEGLPNVAVNCIVYQDSSFDGLYVGTDLGVFFRNSKMGAWKRFSTGLPNVMVADLKINYMTGKIRAATYGRGLWQSDLYVAPGTYQVNAVDLPIVGGDVSGDGVFTPGAKAKMSAKSEPGWKFSGWYENSVKLSDSLEYEFTVNENHNLIGLFEESTGIDDGLLKTQIHVYPNPTKGVVTVKLEKGLKAGLQKVIVTGIDGKTVSETSAGKPGGEFSIDLGSRPEGTYLLTFYFNSGEKVSYPVVVKK